MDEGSIRLLADWCNKASYFPLSAGTARLDARNHFIPFDQPCLVALEFLSAQLYSFSIGTR
jgi:hypothetical protein